MSSIETSLDSAQIRAACLRAERDFYLDPRNFLDYIRDCGACPDALEQPHGEGAFWLMQDNYRPNPEGGPPLLRYKLMLWPRGSFKSHAFDIGRVTWLIAKDPNRRILVASETAKQAQVFVGLAMTIMESPWWKEHFGDHTMGRWYQGKGFWSSQRTEFLKEPTLWATGVEQVQTGMHWTDVIGDDIVSQENTKTQEGIETTKAWLAETLAQLDPGCRLSLIGTRHHYADVYGWILSDPTRRAMFDVSVKKWRDETGKLFFPQRLSKAYVEGQRALMPIRQWSAYYENDPASREEKIFLPEYFRVVKDEEIPTSRIWTYILTDFAFKVHEKNDRTAFWVVGVDPNRCAWVLDFAVGRWKPTDSVGIMLKLWNTYLHYSMRGIAIEDTTHKELIQGLVETIRRDTFVQPTIIPITGRSQEIKDTRIESAEPRFRAGNIYFAQSIKDDPQKWLPMVQEMTEWPFSTHDDIPDAISDLDKCDDKGRFLLPHPPVNYNSSYRHVTPISLPTLVDGKFNPDRPYDPREMLRAMHERANEILQRGHSGPLNSDIWGR